MKDDFEKILGSQFEDHAESVDDQLVWEGIMNKMNHEPKRRVVAWWNWTALGLLALLGFGGIFYAANSKNNETQAASTKNNEIVQSNEFVSVQQPSRSEKNQLTIQNKEEISGKYNSNENSTNLEKKIAKVVNNNTQSLRSSNNVEESRVRNDFDLNQNLPSSRSNVNNSISFDEETKITANSSNEIFKNRTTLASSSDILINQESNIRNQVTEVNILDLPFFLDYNKTFLLDLPENKIQKKQAELSEYELFSSFGIYSSIDFGRAELTSSTLGTDYTDMISSNLSLMEKVGFGFDVNLVKINNWALSSGIGIEMLTDRFSWQGSYIENREGEYIASITKLIDGTAREDREFGSIPWDVTKDIIHYDDRYLITIPLMIGYEIKKGDHRFGANAGIDFKYQGKHTSYILDQFEIPTEYKVDAEWMSPSPRFSLTYGYYLNENWSIGTEFSISRLQSNYAIDPSTSNIGYQMIGTRFSIRYEGW